MTFRKRKEVIDVDHNKEKPESRGGQDDFPTGPWLEANMKALFDDLIAHIHQVNANMKIQMDNAISQSALTNQNAVANSQVVNGYSQLALKNAVEFSQKANDDFLTFSQKQRDQTLENNRYTLDRLYSVFPEEALGIGTMVATVMEALNQAGVIKPTE